MNFFTKAQEEQLLQNGSPEARDKDHAPVVKLYMPFTDCVWLLSELVPEEPHIAFGLCDLGMGFPELGYVSLFELAGINIADITVQRDDSFKPEYPMSVYAEAARNARQITEDKFTLQQAATHIQSRQSSSTPRPQ